MDYGLGQMQNGHRKECQVQIDSTTLPTRLSIYPLENYLWESDLELCSSYPTVMTSMIQVSKNVSHTGGHTFKV